MLTTKYVNIAPMHKYIAFLRAINVGGHIVKMDLLRALFQSLGFSKVETFIASGNVIFESDVMNLDPLKTDIESILAAELGFPVAAFLRTPMELDAILNYQPFPQPILDRSVALNIGFLATVPTDQASQKFLSLQTEQDDLRLHGCELYWSSSVKQSESKLFNTSFEKALKMPSTLRGINTIKKIAERVKP